MILRRVLCTNHSSLRNMHMVLTLVISSVGKIELAALCKKILSCHQKLRSYSTIHGIESIDFHSLVSLSVSI